MMTLENNKKIAIAVLDAINVGDSAAFDKFVDDKVQWWVMGGDNNTTVDKQTVSRLARVIHDGADSPFNFRYGDITAEDDRVIVEAWGGMKMKTGKVYANVYVFKMQIRDGKVIAAREFFDTKILDEHLVPLFNNASKS